MIQKLRTKFILINMTIVTVLLAIILSLTYCFMAARLEMQSVRMMQKIAAAPFRENAQLQAGEDMRLPYFAFRLGPDGVPVAVAGGYYDLSEQDAAFLISKASSSEKRMGVIPDYSLRFCRVEGPHSRYLVFADISSEIQALKSLLHICLLIGALGFLAFFGASVALSAWAVRPVARAFRGQQQFIADASHELKTPLTVIKTNAQIMEAYKEDPALQKKSLQNILTMSEQMRLLIEQMLTLARGDYEKGEKIRVSVDFSHLAQQTVLPFEPLFFEQHMDLQTDIAPGIRVRGNPGELRQILEILLDNAIKYSSPQGAVRVTLSPLPRHKCRLTVSNEGPHIEKEDLDRFFERFASGDPARNQRGSFGLGLAIARNLAENHHGKLFAESQNGINAFHLELPIL